MLAFGTPFLVALLAALLHLFGMGPGLDGARGWAALFKLLSAFGPLLIARQLLLQEVFQVRIGSDGSLTFKTLFGTTYISASDILYTNADAASKSMEETANRQVWIIHTRGKVLIPYQYASRVGRILSALTRLNPGINTVRKC